MVCLEKANEIPAHEWELTQATAEGVTIMPGWGPMVFIGINGKLSNIRFKRCIKVFNGDGKFNPQYDESDTTDLDADYVLIAIGQKVAKTGIEEQFGDRGSISVDAETLQTNIPGVFAAGDDVSGPASVIDAVAAGRKAADEMDKFLGGIGLKSAPKPDDIRDDPYIGRDVDLHKDEKFELKYVDPVKRTQSFELIEQSLSDHEAKHVALQCLRCNLRATITPVVLPPDKWQVLSTEAIGKVPEIEGVYQLADDGKKVFKIVGSADVKGGLVDEVGKHPEGTLFCCEEDRMYSKRESELIQQHLQQYGEMPDGGDDDLDDLF
jgi:hypothetical protein